MSGHGDETGQDVRQKAVRTAGLGAWVRTRPARWVAAGAVVVVLGGAAAAAAHHEEEHRGGHMIAEPEGGRHERGSADDREGGDGRGGRDDRGGRDGHGRKDGNGHDGPDGRTDGAGPDRAAPAPLPAISAADALAKAQAAVAGGRVESLGTVTEQGGGQAWQAVLVGTDGVRHVVTVDGTTGEVTGNTVRN